jgi:hypothetical protein
MPEEPVGRIEGGCLPRAARCRPDATLSAIPAAAIPAERPGDARIV